MRLATIVDGGALRVAAVRGGRVLPLDEGAGFASLREIAAGGAAALAWVRSRVEDAPESAWSELDAVALAAAVPDPGAIYAVGLNYDAPDGPATPEPRPERPLIYAKLPTSVGGHRDVVTWDRSLTANVDAEVELGVVIGERAVNVRPEDALAHVFGYTCIDDISSRDPWLDGDQWLLGKSMAGFCPVGPWIVTPDEIGRDELRLGCTINGQAIQDDTTRRMRFAVEDVIAYISRHVELRPGDLIATGTPARLRGPLGPERHLEAGDVVTVWIERIGEVTTTVV